MMDAIKQIMKQGQKLGLGLEGVVYKITRNVVAKIWYYDAFEDKLQERSLKARFKNLKTKLKTGGYPSWIKIPEFLGIEKCGKNIITYHQYINKTKKRSTPEKILPDKFYDDFCDIHNGNYIVTKKALYLVDIVSCPRQEHEKPI